MPIRACYISKSVTFSDAKKDKSKANEILNDLQRVNVHNNEILNAIMECWNNLDNSPIIWVDTTPYKLQLLEKGNKYVILYQMPLQFRLKPSGKKYYHIIATRKVRLEFV